MGRRKETSKEYIILIMKEIMEGDGDHCGSRRGDRK
jgi:hypothetical protein